MAGSCPMSRCLQCSKNVITISSRASNLFSTQQLLVVSSDFCPGSGGRGHSHVMSISEVYGMSHRFASRIVRTFKRLSHLTNLDLVWKDSANPHALHSMTISPLEFRSEDEGVNHVDYLVRNFIYRLHTDLLDLNRSKF
jgi:hypothetical protein